MKLVKQNGLGWYESEGLSKLGVKHGFFTSMGGASKSELSSLNVKHDIGDETGNVETNRLKIKNQLGVKELKFAKLVHSDDFKEITETDSKNSDIENVDSLITSNLGIAIGLSVADCLPIIIGDGKLLAIIHAGWRGTVVGITSKVTAELVKRGLNTKKAVATFGPCICRKHFEVKDEAAQKLRQLAGLKPETSPYFADLRALNIKQVQQNGIKNIDSLDACSFESSEWFSYRRDHGKTGRNMAAAVIL